MNSTWMTAEERKWCEALDRLARKQPKTLVLHGTGSGGSVVVPFRDYNNGTLVPSRSKEIHFVHIDGGDPDWEIEE